VILKQYQIVAIVFVLSLGFVLGILLSPVITDNDKGTAPAVKFVHPVIQEQTATRNNQILIPSPTDLSDPTTFDQVKAVVSEAESLHFRNLRQKLLLAKESFGSDLDARDPYLSRIYVKRMLMLNPIETLEFLESHPMLTR
jgi:hypothetical protein